MSERMADERFTSLINQRGVFPSWFDPITLELLQAVEAERAEVERLEGVIYRNADPCAADEEDAAIIEAICRRITP